MHKILQIQTMFLAFPRDFPKPILRKLNLHFSLYLVMKIFSQTKKGGGDSDRDIYRKMFIILA